MIVHSSTLIARHEQRCGTWRVNCTCGTQATGRTDRAAVEGLLAHMAFKSRSYQRVAADKLLSESKRGVQ